MGKTEWSLMTGNWVQRNLISWKEMQLGELKNVVLPPMVLLVPQILIPPRRFVTVYILWILKTLFYCSFRITLTFQGYIICWFLSLFLPYLWERIVMLALFVICLSKQIDEAPPPAALRRLPWSTEPNKNCNILHSVSPFYIDWLIHS